MPRICSVCTHEKLNEINVGLLRNDSFRILASRFGTSTASLQRHKSAHIPQTLAKAKEAAETVEAGTLFERLRSINRETLAILQDAKDSKNSVIALQAISRIEKQLELEARLLGELDESTKIAVGVQINAAPSQNLDLAKLSPEELQQLRALIIKAQPVTPAAQLTQGRTL